MTRMKERTLIIFKPDCMEKKLVPVVWDIFQKAGFEVAACKMTMLDDAILKEHYAHIYGKPYYGPLLEFMTRGPVIVSVWEGDEAIARIRKIVGPTNSEEAPKGTIRGDYGKNQRENIVHASDSPETAEKEIARFFRPGEIF